MYTALPFTTQEITTVTRTARHSGAVGHKAVVPAYLLGCWFPPDSGVSASILDFGCGRHEVHVHQLRRALPCCGVVGYDLSLPGSERHLSGTYDVVLASNVLNVQTTPHMLRRTLRQLASLARRGAAIIANYPASPRKAGLTVAEIKAEITAAGLRIRRAEVRGGAPLFVLTATH